MRIYASCTYGCTDLASLCVICPPSVNPAVVVLILGADGRTVDVQGG
jgi:hypothetical protein